MTASLGRREVEDGRPRFPRSPSAEQAPLSWTQRARAVAVTAAVAALALGGAPVAAQDNVLAAAARALGVETIETLRIEGRGADFLFGQAYDGESAWPRFNLPRYTLAIDYRTPAFREERTRTQGQNPPLGGGNQPIPEQRQVWSVSGARAWNGDGESASPAGRERDQRPSAEARQTQIWMTPHGFVKAALKGKTSIQEVKDHESVKRLVTVTAPSGATLVGTINDQGQVERIETVVPTPVLGDVLLDVSFSGYRSFNGVTFPSRIVTREAGYPVLDLAVTAVEANPALSLTVPSRVAAAAPAAPMTAVTQQIADHVWSIGLGPRDRSVLVEFADHLVVIEAPDSEATSLAALEAIHRVVPGKPIRYIVNTHIHFDHSGGLRTYAAEGAIVLTHADNVRYYQQAWSNRRVLGKDRLSAAGRPAAFEGIVGARTLADDTQRMVIYHYAGNMHHPGMLMVHLPRERMLIEADSFNPPNTVGDQPNAMPNLIQFHGVVSRLALDVERIVPLHGRITTMAEAEQAIETFKDQQLWPVTAAESIR